MNKKGFTLIEIIATLVILGVLIAIIVPNFSKIIGKTNSVSGKDVENMLIENLKSYNTDKEKEIWTDSNQPGDCYIMSIAELMHYNSEINLGECLINSYDSLIIQKNDNGYGYYANITCSKSFKDLNKSLLEGENTDDAYYRSANEYTCNNLN